MEIEVKNLHKSFGQFQALREVSLRVEPGSLVALLGPSGCGKTTLLRIVAGLEYATTGTVLFDGIDASARAVRERQVGFVFQHYALFRHMTIFENIAFGLKVKPRAQRPTRQEIHQRVHELLRLVQLDGLADRYPAQLSGGQRQRIALARALAVEPQVLLLDEPFGALDAGVRRELRRWLRRLHDEVKITSLFVTHDQDEALEVADVVVIMDRGEIVQTGTPEEVYAHPATPFVFDFLGNVNLFHGRVHDGTVTLGDRAQTAPRDADGQPLVYVRPHEFELHLEPHAASFPAVIVRIRAAGPVVRVDLRRVDGAGIEVELSHEKYASLDVRPGHEVHVSVRQQRVFALDYSI